MSDLITDTALAEKFEITVAELHRLRKRKGWPHVRLSRFEIRFTAAQVEQIIADLSVSGERTKALDTGLTDRSARRSA